MRTSKNGDQVLVFCAGGELRKGDIVDQAIFTMIAKFEEHFFDLNTILFERKIFTIQSECNH